MHQIIKRWKQYIYVHQIINRWKHYITLYVAIFLLCCHLLTYFNVLNFPILFFPVFLELSCVFALIVFKSIKHQLHIKWRKKNPQSGYTECTSVWGKEASCYQSFSQYIPVPSLYTQESLATKKLMFCRWLYTKELFVIVFLNTRINNSFLSFIHCLRTSLICFLRGGNCPPPPQ